MSTRPACFLARLPAANAYVRQVKVSTAGTLAAHFGRFTERGYDNVRAGGCFRDFVQQFFVRTVVPDSGTSEHGGALFVGGIADEVAGVCDVHFAGHHLLQSFIQRGVVVEACGYAHVPHIPGMAARVLPNGPMTATVPSFQRKQRLGQRTRMLLDAAVL